MDENSALIEKILREDALLNGNLYSHNSGNDDDGEFGWKTVSYQKKNRKPSKAAPENPSDDLHSHPDGASSTDVFRAIELQSEDRRRRAATAAAAAAATVDSAAVNGSKRHSEEDDEDGSDDEIPADGAAVDGGAGEAKKVKQKKPKKPKVTVAEAAAKIDAASLGAFLVDITASYETQQDIQLMRFADYFGRAFASVSSAQFPWLKMFKESTVAKMVDIPLSYIAEDVYKISVDWINQRSLESLGSFVLWSLDSILTDLASHQGVAKGSKKVVQQAPSKSQVAIFVALAMVLRRKPDVLNSLFPKINENPKYQGQDKLPVTVWMIAQASQGDLAVGLYMWVRALLPILSGKSSSNPQSRDLILQLVERILSSPKARPILVNGAARKGERLVPPSALEVLMRFTFVGPSARIKASERFEAIYPTLKEVALSGSSGKAMKQVAQQILNFVMKAAGEGVPELSREASDIFIWCLTQNLEFYKQWDMQYLDNVEASAIILRKLSDEWKEHSVKHPSLDPLRETLKSFRRKNEKALAQKQDTAQYASIKDADKYCKVILGRLSRGGRCMKSMVIISAAMALGAAAVMSQNMQSSWDLKNLLEMFSSA